MVKCSDALNELIFGLCLCLYVWIYFWVLWFSFEQSLAEATKIAKIREELEKLDQELAADVEILRREIEAVTLQYTATR